MKKKILVNVLQLALLQMAAANLALAQSSTDDADSAEAEEASLLDTITVTGSRIPRAGFDTLEPASVISREAIEARGLTNIGDAINEAPSFGVGATPEAGQSSFGVGVNFANQFGLGTARTLSLVNGRRIVSSNTPTIFGPAGPGLQVDLNVIPTQIVDRVESVAVGGAPTYGSDAIAGTINIITRRDYEGAEVSATYGISEESDNIRKNVNGVFGTNIANGRGNLVVSASYDSIDGVLLTDRDWGAAAYSFRGNPCASTVAAGRTPENDGRVNTGVPFQTCTPSAAADGIPNSVLIRNDRFNTFTAGGLLLNRNLQFNGAGDIVAFDRGTPFGTNANTATNSSGGDGFNLSETAQLTSDVERRSGTANFSFNLNDDVRLFAEGLIYNANSLELVDQSIYNVNLFGGLSAPIGFSDAYPLLTDQNRSVLAANNITSFQLSRASRDLVENNARAETELYRTVVGLDGAFGIGDRYYRWEVSVNQGKNDSTFFQTVLNQQNFINALNVAVVDGRVVCSTTPTPGLVIPGGGTPRADAACVPLNLFGEGRSSPEARAYVTDEVLTRTELEQTVFNANIGGDLFDMWGGPAGFNVGFERRIEKGDFQPDFFQQQGLGRAVPITPLTGSFSTKEVFGEFILPFVDAASEIPMLNRFDITGKFRRVDNTVNGEFDAYTIGFQYRPIEDLELRGNITRSLRAPAITELFTPVAEIFTAVPDPCDTRNVGGGTNPAVRQANCQAFYQAFGLNPNDFTSVAVNATIRGVTGGDPNLLNEDSKAKTAGIVWQPSFIDGLRMSLDWYRIDIDDVIANLNAAAIATGCFDNPDFNASDVRNANRFCSLIVRRDDGQIDGITTGFVNGGFQDFTGWQSEILYTKDLSDWGLNAGGRGTVALNLFKLDRLENSINNIVTNVDAGELGNSEYRGQVSFAYDQDRWGVNWQANYTGSAVFNVTNTPETFDILGPGAYWLHNAGVRFDVAENGTLRLAVTNVFNEDPPVPTLGNSAGVYDILGRRYTVSFDWKF